MKTYFANYKKNKFWINIMVSVFFISILFQGCDGCNSSKPVAPPPPTITIPQSVLDCIVGKKVKFTGKYLLLANEISINREADISINIFKVRKTGNDELPEEAKVDLWTGSAVSIDSDGTNPYGFNDESTEDCYKIKYKSKPFDGPSGKCVFEIWARICEETCTITDAHWKLQCDVKPDGSGGSTKAWGDWSVDDSE